MTKARTRSGMRDYHRTANAALDMGLQTGPMAGPLNKLYSMGEQGVRMAFGEEGVAGIRQKANEHGIYPDQYEAFRAGADAAAIKVTQDLSGQISNFELALSRGTNITEDMLPSTIRQMSEYKELQYQHDDARDAAFFDAAMQAEQQGKSFNSEAFLNKWDRDNKLEVEYRDETGKLTGELTPYGMKLVEIGVIKPKAATPTKDLPSDFKVVG